MTDTGGTLLENYRTALAALNAELARGMENHLAPARIMDLRRQVREVRKIIGIYEGLES